MQSNGLSRVFSNTAVQKHQFFGAQLPLTLRNLTGFPGGASGKEPTCQCRRRKRRSFRPVPGWGRSPGEGNGNPLQCSCLENPWTKEPGGLHTVRGVTKSWTRLKRVSSPLATNVRVDPAGGGRGHEHRGHFRLFSPCFQESLTTYPSTTSTSQPTSHSTKRRWTELLSNVPKGWLELFFHIV